MQKVMKEYECQNLAKVRFLPFLFLFCANFLSLGNNFCENKHTMNDTFITFHQEKISTIVTTAVLFFQITSLQRNHAEKHLYLFHFFSSQNWKSRNNFLFDTFYLFAPISLPRIYFSLYKVIVILSKCLFTKRKPFSKKR
jgi:hypothetical protein